MVKNINTNLPKEFEFLVQEILYLLESEQKSKYYVEEEKGEEHYIEENLASHGLNPSNIKSIEKLTRILKFTKELIEFLEEKFCKFPEGYYFYKDAVQRMKKYTEVLDSFQKSEVYLKK